MFGPAYIPVCVAASGLFLVLPLSWVVVASVVFITGFIPWPARPWIQKIQAVVFIICLIAGFTSSHQSFETSPCVI